MSNIPALKAERYYVYPSEGEPYEARLLWGDNLRAELEGNKRGVKAQAQPFLFLTLTCWAHAVRTGLTTDKFDAWHQQVADIVDAAKADKRAGLAADDDAADDDGTAGPT